MILTKFRQRYPQGSLVSELVKIDRGIYIVKVSVGVNNQILATALAGADRVEAAEDAARERAIAALDLASPQPVENNNFTSKVEAGETSPSTNLPAMPKQPSAPSARELDSHIVNFSEPQSEIPDRPTTNSNAKTVSSIPESPVTQPNIEPNPEPQPVANTSSLFDQTFTGEVLGSPDPIDPQPQTNDLELTSSLETDIVGTAEIEAMDFNEIKQKTDIEIRRLGWTKDNGRDFLKSRYGKRSRLHLTDEQLLEFLRYLEKLPTPVQ